MAKHIKGKFVSKGLRHSGGAITKAAHKPIAGNLNTAMREAFLSTDITDNIRFSRMGNIVIKAAQQPPKLTADQIKGWTTKLSFRTFKALQEQGVLA